MTSSRTNRVMKILRIIRNCPGYDAIQLRGYGIRPQDAGFIRILEKEGFIEWRKGGWHITGDGDLALAEEG